MDKQNGCHIYRYRLSNVAFWLDQTNFKDTNQKPWDTTTSWMAYCEKRCEPGILEKGRLPTKRIYISFGKNKIKKRPTGLNGHLSIRDFTLTSCQRSSYLHINRSIIEWIKNNNGRGKLQYNHLICTYCIYM